MDQHSHFVDTKSQQSQQLRGALHQSVDQSPLHEKMNLLNNKWKVVRGAADVQFKDLSECSRLLKRFEENVEKIRKWTYDSDLSQVSSAVGYGRKVVSARGF